MYKAIFSRRAQKAFLDLPDTEARKIKESIEKLRQNPKIHGTIKLENVPAASYRYRTGNYRILFDINDDAKMVEILDIRKRDDRTYR